MTHDFLPISPATFTDAALGDPGREGSPFPLVRTCPNVVPPFSADPTWHSPTLRSRRLLGTWHGPSLPCTPASGGSGQPRGGLGMEPPLHARRRTPARVAPGSPGGGLGWSLPCTPAAARQRGWLRARSRSRGLGLRSPEICGIIGSRVPYLPHAQKSSPSDRGACPKVFFFEHSWNGRASKGEGAGKAGPGESVR